MGAFCLKGQDYEINRLDIITALFVSFSAVIQSTIFFRRSFRPIVTAMVRKAAGGNEAIAYNLVLLNSGTIPAKNITLYVRDQRRLEAALDHASYEHRSAFLSCFTDKNYIPIIHNGSEVSCSFGYTKRTDGFWKPGATFPICIRYEGMFGSVYTERQIIKITNSENFTGTEWNS